MPIDNLITSILNMDEDDIEECDSHDDNGVLVIDLKLKDKRPDCPYCRGSVKIKDYKVQKIKLADLNTKETIVRLHKRRYVCKDCNRSFMEDAPLGPKNTNVSWATIMAIMKDVALYNETYSSIAERHHVSTSQVLKYVDSFIIVPRLRLPESLGIDELHSPKLAKRNSSFIAILVDNKKRVLFDVLKSRSKEELIRYFSNIPREERLNVKYVTIDMREPYRDVAKTYLPNAKICSDPFHVVKELTRLFDNYRINLMNQYSRKSKAYYLLKSFNKLLLSDSYNFDINSPGKFNKTFGQYLNYYQIRKMILDLDPILKEAYHLKEAFRSFIKDTKPEEAKDAFNELLKDFIDYDLPLYQSFIKLLKNWKNEIINSFDRPYDNRKQSNALAENINGKLGALIDVSNGFGNFDRFRARALYIFNSEVHYSLTDVFKSNKAKGKARGKYNKD